MFEYTWTLHMWTVNGFSEWEWKILWAAQQMWMWHANEQFQNTYLCATIGDWNANNVWWKFTFWWVRLSNRHLPQSCVYIKRLAIVNSAMWNCE